MSFEQQIAVGLLLAMIGGSAWLMYKEPRAFERIGGYAALACAALFVLLTIASGLYSHAAAQQRTTDSHAFGKIITDRSLATTKAVNDALSVGTIPKPQRDALIELLALPTFPDRHDIPDLIPGWIYEWLFVLMVSQYVLLLISIPLHRHTKNSAVAIADEIGSKGSDD